MAYPSALDLDLANTALARLSESGIAAFTENSPKGRAVARIYPKTRDLLFEAVDWDFATCRSVLTGQAAGPYPWTFSYALPPNVSRSRLVMAGAAPTVGQAGDGVPFEQGIQADLATRVIYCDVSPAILVYTALIVDPSVWSNAFVSAFTVQLAAELAMPVTGNGQIAQAMREAAAAAIGAITSVNVQSAGQVPRGPSATTAARR